MQSDRLARRDQYLARAVALTGQVGQRTALDLAVGTQPFRLIGGNESEKTEWGRHVVSILVAETAPQDTDTFFVAE